MNTLRRIDKRPDGIFGEFTFEGDPGRFCFTLEHAYPVLVGAFEPHIPPGVYACARGTHRLRGGVPFETFEITGVDGHTGLLFHAGNFNLDSSGCVLIGKTIAVDPNTGEEMITGSRDEFREWMGRLDGVTEFQLEVI